MSHSRHGWMSNAGFEWPGKRQHGETEEERQETRERWGKKKVRQSATSVHQPIQFLVETEAKERLLGYTLGAAKWS